MGARQEQRRAHIPQIVNVVVRREDSERRNNNFACLQRCCGCLAPAYQIEYAWICPRLGASWYDGSADSQFYLSHAVDVATHALALCNWPNGELSRARAIRAPIILRAGSDGTLLVAGWSFPEKLRRARCRQKSELTQQRVKGQQSSAGHQQKQVAVRKDATVCSRGALVHGRAESL